VLRFGTADVLMNRSAVGSLTGAMLMRGTTQRSRAQIRERFDALRAQASISGTSRSASAQVTTTRENLPAALELAFEVLTQPSFDAAEFEQLKRERLAGLESMRSEPQAIAGRVLARHGQPWPKGHPLYVPTLDEEIEELAAVTLDDVKRYYEQMYGASSGTFVAVGAFDPAQVRSLLEQHVAVIRGKVPFERIANPYSPVPAANIDIETPDKANAIYLAAQPVQVSETHEDYAALVMADFMFGGGFLNSRLATRVRQAEGLSYGVGSGFAADAIDERGTFQVYAIYAPENRERLEAAIEDELRKALTEGFSADELEAAKNGWLQQAALDRASDQALRAMISNNVFFGRTMQHQAAIEDRIRALTAEEVNAAFRRHIAYDRMVRVKAGDFAAHRID
jgi:zinc protease